MRYLHTGAAIACWFAIGILIWASQRPMLAEAVSPKVVILVSQDSPPYAEVVNGFRASMAAGGVREGIEVYSLRGNSGNVSNVLRQFKGEHPAMFLTVGSLATQAVLTEQGEVPVVASLTPHLEKLRIKGNLTGVGFEFSLEEQFEAMRRMLPELSTVGVLYSPKENQETVDTASKLARKIGVQLIAKPIETPRELPDVLESLANNIDLLWGITDQVVVSPQTAEPILLFSFRNKIPFAGLSAPWVKAGSLYALDRDYGDIGAQCAEIALRVLNKTAPHTIQVVPPRKMLLSINLKTARAMKIELPQPVIDAATQVLQ
ncbi:MAG: ABC transporter substrate-binding protein [Nitrospira sp.]|nr:ABC transporter substrate-binding protein [Nitrospira sp.]MDH4245235.1 ABC transporter substrate-binding protein [Nitrospira sp.]MDH4357116.1 ABC transporter substrate-binding protein [Nitrospira sp.]MDH5318162.1 ABC transporter substrate-binding protein [Nitrospira sp.]